MSRPFFGEPPADVWKKAFKCPKCGEYNVQIYPDQKPEAVCEQCGYRFSIKDKIPTILTNNPKTAQPDHVGWATG
jgi:transcription elongation factor Elf1